MALHAQLDNLDRATNALIEDLKISLTLQFPDLLNLLLFGSVARHEERPLDNLLQSDVDLLAIFDSDDDPLLSQRGLQIIHTIGEAIWRHQDAPREVDVKLASRAMSEWDTDFVHHIAQDAIVLYGQPPPVLMMQR